MSTPITIGGVTCYELWRDGRAESAIEDYSQEAVTAVRVLRCAWSDRLKLVRALRGGVHSSGQLVPPMTYPDFPRCYCSNVHIEGEGKAAQAGAESMISYTDAILTVNYETPDYSVVDLTG